MQILKITTEHPLARHLLEINILFLIKLEKWLNNQHSSRPLGSGCAKKIMCSFKLKNYFQHSEILTLWEAGRKWDQAWKEQVYNYNSPRINPKISEPVKSLFSLSLSDFFFLGGVGRVSRTYTVDEVTTQHCLSSE